MSYIRNSPISITDIHREPSWFIDRTGDRSLINDEWNFNINNNITNSFNNSNAMAASYPTHINYNYISNYNNINYDTLIYYPSYNTASIRSVSCELVLDQYLQFSEEQCECCICMDQKEEENICQLNCKHVFCVTCIDSSIKTFRDRNQDVICALCRTEVKKITFKKQENIDKIKECL